MMILLFITVSKKSYRLVDKKHTKLQTCVLCSVFSYIYCFLFIMSFIKICYFSSTFSNLLNTRYPDPVKNDLNTRYSVPGKKLYPVHPYFRHKQDQVECWQGVSTFTTFVSRPSD